MAAEVIRFKHRAFIVFDKADAAWAEELQRELENTRIPWELIGKATPLGPVPRDLKPVFRYGDEVPEGQVLTDAASAALAESLFLVVLCSPDGAKSELVNKAVCRFKASGKRERIIPVIIAGAPKDEERECFAPGLRYKTVDDGTLSIESEDPVAPLVIDARPEGDGKDTAILRLKAALLGVDSAALIVPTEKAGKRRSWLRRSIVAVLVLLAIAGGAVGWMRYQLATDAAMLDRTLETGTSAAVRLLEFADQFGLPRSAVLSLGQSSESMLRDLAQWGPDGSLLRAREAAILLAFSRLDEALGHPDGGRQRMAKAAERLAAIKADDVGNADRQRDIALVELAAGNALLARGLPDEALKLLRPGFAIMERRDAANPDNAERQRDLSLAANALGDALMAKGALDEALQRYREALTIRERLLARDPRNEAWRRDLSVSHERIGDVLAARSESNDALQAYRTGLALRLAAVDPDAPGVWQRQLSIVYNKIGDVLVERGALDEALNAYRGGLALQLAAANRDNAGRRDLSVSYERIGDVLRTQRSWDEALAAYRASLAIRDRLVAADPANPRWARDLPVSHERIGDALMGRGAVDEAIEAYRTSLAQRERLSGSDEDRVASQRDIAVSHNKLGDALASKGQTEEALKNFRAGLAIRERLVALDPANAQLQWDLLVLQWRLASSGDDPAKRFGQIVATMRDLAAKRQLSVEQARWLPAAEQELARVKGY